MADTECILTTLKVGLTQQHLSPAIAPIKIVVFLLKDTWNKPEKYPGYEQTYLDLQGWRAVEQSVVSEVLCRRCQEAAAYLAVCVWLDAAQPKTAKFLPDDFLVHLQISPKHNRPKERHIFSAINTRIQFFIIFAFGKTTLEDPFISTELQKLSTLQCIPSVSTVCPTN